MVADHDLQLHESDNEGLELSHDRTDGWLCDKQSANLSHQLSSDTLRCQADDSQSVA